MKAKRVIGMVATMALTVSTILGPTMPIYAENVDGGAVAAPAEATSQPAQESAPAAEPAAVETPPATQEVPATVPETTPTVLPEGTPAVPETQVTVPETPTMVPETQNAQQAEQQSQPAAQETQPAEQTQPENNETGSTAAETAGEGSNAAETAEEESTSGQTSEDGAPLNENGDGAAAENSTETGEPGTEIDNTEGDEEEGSEDLAMMIGTSMTKTSGDFTMDFDSMNTSTDGEKAGITADSLEASQTADTSTPAYTGIEINGDFSQWDGVEKTDVSDGNVKTLAMVFDKDVYIYIEGEDVDWGTNDVAVGAGIHNDGMFVLTTDTGREFVFFIRTDGIYDRAGNKIEDSETYYDNATHQFEIKIPSGVIKQYKETISLGYYLEPEVDENGNVVLDQDGNQVQHQIISDVADLSESGLGTTPNEITQDGLYGDWDTYHHTLIQYSTAKGDAEGAMYADGENLMMHVKTYLENQSPYLYKDITLKFNRNDSQCVNLTVVAVDNNGNVMNSADGLYDTTAGKKYHYYIVDENAWGMGGQNIFEDSTYWNWNQTQRVRWLYGEIDVDVNGTGTEMEVKLDMAELANRLGVDQQDLKYIQAQFENIGQQWISCAGTSSGPIPGILMGIGVVAFAAWGIRKKENGEKLAQ